MREKYLKLFGDKLSIQIKERDTKSFNFDMKLELLNNKLSQIMKKYRYEITVYMIIFNNQFGY